MANRTILITGGSGRFGNIFVKYFLNAGDKVIATACTQKSLIVMQAEHEKYGDNFHALQSDLVDEAAPSKLCEALMSKGYFPDCLINNARSQLYLGMTDDGRVSRKDFLGEFLLDVIAPYELTMALALQEDTCLKHVINVGSQYGTVAYNSGLYDNPKTESPLHYSVAKAGLAQLTKELAVRLAPLGILVNCIAYGGLEGNVSEAFKMRYAKYCPQGRMLTEHEIVGPVDKILSSSFSAMTGHVLVVDGGWTIW